MIPHFSSFSFYLLYQLNTKCAYQSKNVSSALIYSSDKHLIGLRSLLMLLNRNSCRTFAGSELYYSIEERGFGRKCSTR